MTVAAGIFKSKCLKYMDEVADFQKEIIITKHGKPVAKLVPIPGKTNSKSIFGYMQNTVRINGDIISPIKESWNADQ